MSDNVLPSWHDAALQMPFVDAGIGEVAYGETVRVADCAYGKLAWGNCMTVSDEIVYSCDGADNTDAIMATPTIEIDLVRCHVAVFDHEIDLVVDYTLRQFGNELAFPFVGTITEWQNVLENSTGVAWELDLPYSVAVKHADVVVDNVPELV